MLWTLATNLLGPMALGVLVTVSAYELWRFYRPRRLVIVRRYITRAYTRRTPGQSNKAA